MQSLGAGVDIGTKEVVIAEDTLGDGSASQDNLGWVYWYSLSPYQTILSHSKPHPALLPIATQAAASLTP